MGWPAPGRPSAREPLTTASWPERVRRVQADIAQRAGRELARLGHAPHRPFTVTLTAGITTHGAIVMSRASRWATSTPPRPSPPPGPFPLPYRVGRDSGFLSRHPAVALRKAGPSPVASAPRRPGSGEDPERRPIPASAATVVVAAPTGIQSVGVSSVGRAKAPVAVAILRSKNFADGETSEPEGRARARVHLKGCLPPCGGAGSRQRPKYGWRE